jgi:hypothetical protein
MVEMAFEHSALGLCPDQAAAFHPICYIASGKA